MIPSPLLKARAMQIGHFGKMIALGRNRPDVNQACLLPPQPSEIPRRPDPPTSKHIRRGIRPGSGTAIFETRGDRFKRLDSLARPSIELLFCILEDHPRVPCLCIVSNSPVLFAVQGKHGRGYPRKPSGDAKPSLAKGNKDQETFQRFTTLQDLLEPARLAAKTGDKRESGGRKRKKAEQTGSGVLRSFRLLCFQSQFLA